MDDRAATPRSCLLRRLPTLHQIPPRVYTRRSYPERWKERVHRFGPVTLPSKVTSSRVTHLFLLIPTLRQLRLSPRATAPPPAQHRPPRPPPMAFSAAMSHHPHVPRVVHPLYRTRLEPHHLCCTRLEPHHRLLEEDGAVPTATTRRRSRSLRSRSLRKAPTARHPRSTPGLARAARPT